MGYQNDPDGTRNEFSYVSEIGPKMWYQDGNCAHFGFCLGTKSPMMGPPNHAYMVSNESCGLPLSVESIIVTLCCVIL